MKTKELSRGLRILLAGFIGGAWLAVAPFLPQGWYFDSSPNEVGESGFSIAVMNLWLPVCQTRIFYYGTQLEIGRVAPVFGITLDFPQDQAEWDAMEINRFNAIVYGSKFYKLGFESGENGWRPALCNR